ncbi:THAP domain-containing protein 3 isoform X4 [Brienomyrus brachyistius]|uniref:THAP domain-containing protein 3 isoform X4 n=1 Tax=Brienomyrus brachyistius TaxID=42636 RepID=UPI0020B320C2|nr:THAP domain-containing protein 3 isoform X4 [Brienomyrus brachyistius]
MPKSCSAYNCRSRYSRRNPDLTFHRFPLSKPSVLKEWLDNIGRRDFQPKKHMVICSHHFTPDCFSGLGNRRNLLWNAVPTLFSFSPPSPKRMKSQKRLSTEKSQIPLKLLESRQEDVNARQPEPLSTDEATGAESRQLNCDLQDLRATEHSYALAGPCAAKGAGELAWSETGARPVSGHTGQWTPESASGGRLWLWCTLISVCLVCL